MNSHTLQLLRVFRAPPDRVYRAFLEPDAMAKWIPPHGFTCKVHHMDAREGGSFRMSFIHFASGKTHSFGGEFLELKPSELLRYTDTFDDPNLPGLIQVTVRLRAVGCGTELSLCQEGIPSVIPIESCHLGWQESLQLLALLIEAEIPC